jgi:hypothetical protein
LPKFVWDYFTRKDDASFWGAEEDLGLISHGDNTPYARTENVNDESAHEGPTFPPIASIKKPWDRASDRNQAEKFSGESFLRVYVIGYSLLNLQ